MAGNMNAFIYGQAKGKSKFVGSKKKRKKVVKSGKR